LVDTLELLGQWLQAHAKAAAARRSPLQPQQQQQHSDDDIVVAQHREWPGSDQHVEAMQTQAARASAVGHGRVKGQQGAALGGDSDEDDDDEAAAGGSSWSRLQQAITQSGAVLTYGDVVAVQVGGCAI
jgi:hypothetical protein